MKSIISRAYQKDMTKGCWLVMDGSVMDYKCVTLELPDLGNQHNISCIPEGIYDVEKINHPEKGWCFSVLNEPNREGILIHKGNFTKNTLGCILVGSYFEDINGDGVLDVAESKKAMDRLLGILPSTFKLYIL